jgi:hypothetical protein
MGSITGHPSPLPRWNTGAVLNGRAVLTDLALVLCYTPALRGMFEQWSNDEDMSNGFVVPIVVLWIVWRERAGGGCCRRNRAGGVLRF